MKVKSESEVAQSCPTLLDPLDFSLPGSSVHGIFQARVLEWGAIAFSMTSYAMWETGFDPWVGKIPLEKGKATPVFWPGEFHGLYSP